MHESTHEWNKRKDFNCRVFFENGLCPKERYNSRRCPLNIIPNMNTACIYSGNRPDQCKLGDEPENLLHNKKDMLSSL